MKPNLHARARAVLNCVVKFDSPIALLHVLYAVIFLAEAGDNVADLLTTELFCSTEIGC